MEEIITQELRLQEQLQNLELRQQALKRKNKAVNLTDISIPDDIGAIAEFRRQSALTRNVALLHDLETESAKLHTKTFCPIDSRLEELKQRFLESGNAVSKQSLN